MFLTEAGIMPQSVDDNNHLPTYSTPASEISIADLIAGVNDEKGNLFKYLPDSMLDETQRNSKRIGLQQEESRLLRMREESTPTVNTGNATVDRVVTELLGGGQVMRSHAKPSPCLLGE